MSHTLESFKRVFSVQYNKTRTWVNLSHVEGQYVPHIHPPQSLNKFSGLLNHIFYAPAERGGQVRHCGGPELKHTEMGIASTLPGLERQHMERLRNLIFIIKHYNNIRKMEEREGNHPKLSHSIQLFSFYIFPSKPVSYALVIFLDFNDFIHSLL